MKKTVYTFLVFSACLLLSLFWMPDSAMADEYTFDLSEIEKKPYQIGGYAEFRANLLRLDNYATLYKLNFYNNEEGDTVEEYNAELQLEGSFEKGISRLYIKTNTDYVYSYLEEYLKTTLYEGYLSLRPSSSMTVDAGKKVSKWGKGYAWNPVAFVDRPKNPNDPEVSLEGFVVASADYIKSFHGAIKTVSITPVFIPVYEHINNDFGETNNFDFAAKLYLLLYDTDIDFMLLTGGSKAPRYGTDFSRNITSNFEIHGEFATIRNFKTTVIDSDGNRFQKEYNAKNYLLGLRYLTASDLTYIAEYYHNGTGFTTNEMEDYFTYINTAYDVFLSAGDETLLKDAENISAGNYGRTSPMRNYLYLRVSQKEPFDILYFTPAMTGIYNINDGSFSLSPELLYTAITNIDLRLKVFYIDGGRNSEYGEKQNDYRIEFRGRYYF